MNLFGSRIAFTLFLALAAGSGCAAPRAFELSSLPAADITNFNGEPIGVTPIQFTPEQIAKCTIAPDLIAIRLSVRGHIERDVILPIRSENSYTVKLTAADADYFTQRWIKDYSPQMNRLARELLEIQGFLITKNIPEAEKAIESFEKRYPPLAAIYVLKGNLELMKGNKTEAHGYFLRAQSIDAEDPVAARLSKQQGQP